MNSGRTSPLLLSLLVLVLGCGAFVAFQYQSRQRAALAEMETRQLSDAAQDAASNPSRESVEAPAISSDRRADSDALSPTQRTEVEAKELELQVLDPTNAPVPAAKILLFRGDEVLAEGSTDANGLARFSAHAGTGEYVLAASGWDFARGALDFSPGRRTVSLVENASVAGAVLVDGAAPGTPMELSWNPDDRADAVKALPGAVAKALRLAHGNRGATVALTTPDGAFVFRGIAADATGTIQWTAPYFLETDGSEYDRRRLSVPTPRRDLVLRLLAGTELRLRVVDPAGAALPGAAISLERYTKTPDGTSWTTESGVADGEGRYTKALAPEPFNELTVSVSAPLGGGSRSYKFVPPPERRGVWDLGDVATRATRQLSVLVQDTLGQPIKDAQAMPWPAPAARRSRERTDATGRITIGIAAEEAEIAVEAFGYSGARVTVPAQVLEVIATLGDTTVIEFEVLDSPENKQGLVIELTGPTPLFVGEGSEGPSTPKSASGSWSSSTDDKLSSFETEADRTGHWRIAGLTANQALHATLKGGGKTLSEAEIAPLSAGEHRTIELRMEEVGKVLRLRVLSPEGKPLSDATVYLCDPKKTTSYRGRGVDIGGEIQLTSMYGDACTILVHAAGYPMKWTTLRPIPDGTVDITLEPPHSVEIELVRPDGSLVPEEARVWANPLGSSLPTSTPFDGRATLTSPGRYHLDSLPATEVLISARGAWGTVSQLHDGSVPFARIVIGGAGTIQARIRGSVAEDESMWSIAIAAAGSARDLTRDVLYSIEEDLAQSTVRGLLDGRYEVWLEKRSEDSGHAWSRVGEPTTAVIGAEHPSVEIELPSPP